MNSSEQLADNYDANAHQETGQAIPVQIVGSVSQAEHLPAMEWDDLVQFRIDHWSHKVIASAIIVLSCCLMWWTRNNEWGVFWTIWIPCWLSFIPAIALLRHRALGINKEHGVLLVRSGLIKPQTRTLIMLDEVQLCAIPMGGLAGVVVRQSNSREQEKIDNKPAEKTQETAIATWVRKTKANQILTWIDESYKPIPRFSFVPQHWDR